MLLSSRRILRQHWVRKATSFAAAEYLRVVFFSNHRVIPPEILYARAEPNLPVILAMWHGQHLLAPFIQRRHDKAKVLISHHRDGDVNALTAERLGVEVIRGSGDPGGRFDHKGGVGAFRQMLEALQAGYSIALTADVPKIARKASLGVVKLASLSGRPIYSIAMATSRRVVLDNWDRTTINLPFGRLGCALGEPVWVPSDADDAQLEDARHAVERSLDDVTTRAYALTGAPEKADRP